MLEIIIDDVNMEFKRVKVKALKIFSIVVLTALFIIPINSLEVQAKSASQMLYEIQVRKRTLERKLRKLKEEKASISGEISELDQQVDALNSKVAELEIDINNSRKDLEALLQRLKEIIDEIERKKNSVKKRVITTYMQGELTYLYILFNAENFRDFMNRVFYLSLIFDNDKKLISELERKKAEKEEHKRKIEAKIADIASKQEELKERRREVGELRRSKTQLLSRISQDAELAERQIRELEEESRRIESDIRRLQGRYKGPAWKGKLLKPVDGSIRSGFGYRRHPISKRVAMHTGVDIAAPHGTPIRAGGTGMVIFTGWRGGYGLTIIIDHGGKISTLYAHLSHISVSVGTIVQAGQVIGNVGSTGYSTGPHLHFEVRVNGTPVDPMGNL